MIELVIKGNKEPYQLNNRIEYLEISMSGEHNYNPASKMKIVYGGTTTLVFDNSASLFQFGEKIKGAQTLELISLLKEFNFDDNFANSLSRKSQTEISLFKSLFLIYGWVDIAFTDAYAVSLGSKIYDEFIIDYTAKAEAQKDVYFIKHEYVRTEYVPYIERLVELNLLASVFFGGILGNYQSYFIPLIKPGVSRRYFNNPRDPSGDKTYAFWKMILSDRDWRFNLWFKNRF